MEPITPHDSQRQFGLSGIWTCNHLHASPELYHCAMDADYLVTMGGENNQKK